MLLRPELSKVINREYPELELDTSKLQDLKSRELLFFEELFETFISSPAEIESGSAQYLERLTSIRDLHRYD